MIMRMFAQFALSVMLVLGAVLPSAAAEATSPGRGEFIALCYHNIEDEAPDQTFDGVTTAKLIEQLSWLQNQGYQAVSVDDVLAARAGKKELPAKAMLLTFDDGYVSFYQRVYPILKSFNFPAVLAVVDEWMPVTEGGRPAKIKGEKAAKVKADNRTLANVKTSDHVNYGGTDLSRDMFLTWAQVREMQASGLVEIASHSSALHKGVDANPQGSKQPFAVTSTFDAATGSYEMVERYVRRLQDDAAASSRTIKRFTGKAPRVMVWPYGAYNEIGILVNERAGMPVTLTLDDGYAKVSALRDVPRALIKDDPEMGDFAVQIRQYSKVAPMRVVQVDLDYVYDPNPEQEARNLDALISRIYALKINTVYLQAFSDPTFQGHAKEVYFPNRFLPVRQDLFNRVAWQLKTRAMVDVYGWLPVLSFDFGADVDMVTKWNPDSNTADADPKAYKRVSPYDPEGRRRIIGIYEDLARHAPIDGLLFHDDAMLSDFEDASPSALRAYQAAGFPSTIAAIRADQRTMDKWTSFKTETLIGLTKELTAHVSAYRAPLKTVRNIYAAPVINQGSEEWFAQNYDRFLEAYDYTAVEAMPRMENVPDAEHEQWLANLIGLAAKRPNGLKKTVFELQSVDWRIKDKGRAIPTEELGAQMNQLARAGAMNFGYYPDDFIANVPDASVLHKDFSLQTYPYLP